eukprot:CAMPEP_0178420820 /NCGR_PEP_ID=MMETSP0689_2-20121128/26327_1 /TAXON_ID=160604 /ORGANISM="Amphidinium massartii, Strain CS-259" /LENGTH=197 /DNA_ID=CAMNT_0020042309 /DNA_START=63 /DNA_END=656 /DNA_ORIENTATION=+
MALITGGLGGLGLLAANELAGAGAPFVVTSSRSGRPTAMQPQLMQIMEKMQQSTVHYMVQCDASDGAATMDLFAALTKPTGVPLGSVQQQPPALAMDEQATTLKEVIAHLEDRKSMLPEEKAESTIAMLKGVVAKLYYFVEGARQKGSSDMRLMLDCQAEVTELVGKLKEMAIASPPSLDDVRKLAAKISQTLDELM